MKQFQHDYERLFRLRNKIKLTNLSEGKLIGTTDGNFISTTKFLTSLGIGASVGILLVLFIIKWNKPKVGINYKE